MALEGVVLNTTQHRLSVKNSLCQRIIVSTVAETFAKEAKLVGLFRELQSTPVRYHQKVHWFFSYACNAKFAAFWCFAAEQHVDGCFFANIDVSA